MSLFFQISFLIQKEKIKACDICVFYIDFGIFCKRFILWKICILAYVSVIHYGRWKYDIWISSIKP